MNKKLIMVIVSIIFFIILIPTLFYKPLVGINAYLKTDIRKIKSITNAEAGRPLVLVVGTTKTGFKKGVWFDKRSFINFKFFVEANLENSISKEEALTIIKENQLLHTVSYLQLQYFNDNNTTAEISEGPYWHAVDSHFGYDNGSTRYIYIDPFTKKYILIENHNKVLKNTIY
jgi:hypothetical protein